MAGRVTVDGSRAQLGQQVTGTETVTLDGTAIANSALSSQTILLHKPTGYVCSRSGQGSKTIYDLLPHELHALRPAGRLDKDSSGLLLMTTNGQLLNQLTHPRYEKEKVYDVTTSKALTPEDLQKINQGIQLEDGLSHMQVMPVNSSNYTVTMHEGRNRQIRRTFSALGYQVVMLKRTVFGPYQLGSLSEGLWLQIEPTSDNRSE